MSKVCFRCGKEWDSDSTLNKFELCEPCRIINEKMQQFIKSKAGSNAIKKAKLNLKKELEKWKCAICQERFRLPDLGLQYLHLEKEGDSFKPFFVFEDIFFTEGEKGKRYHICDKCLGKEIDEEKIHKKLKKLYPEDFEKVQCAICNKKTLFANPVNIKIGDRGGTFMLCDSCYPESKAKDEDRASDEDDRIFNRVLLKLKNLYPEKFQVTCSRCKKKTTDYSSNVSITRKGETRTYKNICKQCYEDLKEPFNI